ncbi:MAG: aromatic amino acid lyase, partial [Bdellovibrionota bacterium]
MLTLGEKPLRLQDIYDVAVKYEKVELSPDGREKIGRSHKFLRSEIESGKPMYGVNTGFGLLSDVSIPAEDLETLQYNLIRSHACGAGELLDDIYSRAMLLLRANALVAGYSGVSVKLVEHVLTLLNRGVCPLIPSQGSVGASGDLAPLAHLALVLIGEGRARVKGEEMSGAAALRAAGLKPIRLGPKEGLSLINGTQFMTSLGVLGLLEAEQLAYIADICGAMTLEAMRGTEKAFEPEIQELRPHPGQIMVADRIRSLLLTGGFKS